LYHEIKVSQDQTPFTTEWIEKMKEYFKKIGNKRE